MAPPHAAWIASGVLVVFIASTVWFFLHGRERAVIQDPVPNVQKSSPGQSAREALEALAAATVEGPETRRDSFHMLSVLLRLYLREKAGIGAIRMTTREVLEELLFEAWPRTRQAQVAEVLSRCDRARFGGPGPTENDWLQCIETTRELLTACGDTTVDAALLSDLMTQPIHSGGHP